MNLESNHLTEWLNSGVDEELIALNVQSLSGTLPYEYLLYSPKISRRNDGRLRDRDLKKYQHIEHGGWWCSGVDPLNDYQQMLWGCFKPDKPRRDPQKIHKHIKYEHPYKEQTRTLFLFVTNKIWVKVANRCGIPITDQDLQHHGGFWHWVWKNNVPVVIVEGAKKAACLLTAGYAAIAISGVNTGYRTPSDEYGTATCVERSRNIGKPLLIPDLAHFATSGRLVNICFDHDTKPETVQRVRTAITRMGRLLINSGCQLRVIDLPGTEKGVDDFVVAQGCDAFHALYNTAETLELWEIKLFTLLTYPPAIALNQRFLSGLIAPEGEKLIVLKAPKGTGKTEWLSSEVAKAHDQGRKVLIITHRIQLGEALCDRFGVDYVSEIKTSDTGGLLGYGVCVDSLHKDSQARFNPNDWSNDVIIIDECDQVFWHLLHSTTDVAKRRVAILRNFKQLLQNVLGSEHGKIYLSSADASDTDIKYILSLAGEYKVNPFVIVNNYQPVSGKCYNYSGSNPKNLIAALDKAIAKGGHHLLCCSAQKAKSKWGTQALEQRFKQKFPHLRILRIDSHSVLDPKHGAFECIAHLNEILTQYDLVIASPSLETGVSIWYPQLRLHYYLTVGREFLTSRDSKRAKAQAEAGENAIWKPDFNKGQMLSSVLFLESLNLLQLLTPGEKLRGSDQRMQKFKAIALQHRFLIKNYLNVTISEKLTSIAIAQKLLDKIDLRLSYIGRLGPRGKRECVYKFVTPNDGRDCIFRQWLSRELVSVSSNINVPTPITDTTSLPSNEDMGGQENPTDSWWQQVKCYFVSFMERLEFGVDAIKEFLSTLKSDERWGVMVVFEEAQPQIFGQLVSEAPEWLEWMS